MLSCVSEMTPGFARTVFLPWLLSSIKEQCSVTAMLMDHLILIVTLLVASVNVVTMSSVELALHVVLVIMDSLAVNVCIIFCWFSNYKCFRYNAFVYIGRTKNIALFLSQRAIQAILRWKHKTLPSPILIHQTDSCFRQLHSLAHNNIQIAPSLVLH